MASTSKASLKVALEDILTLNNVQDILEPADIDDVDAQERAFAVIDQLRFLTETLDELNQPNLNLFNKDYFELFVEMIDIAQKTFIDPVTNEPKWTDFRPTNIGTLFLSVLAANLDKKYYLDDRMFAQVFLQTVTQFPYFYMRANEENFQPLLRTAAQTTVRFSLGSIRGVDVPLPPGIQLGTTDGGLVFETSESTVIPAGNVVATAIARHWQTRSQSVNYTGQPNTTVTLDEPNILDEDFVVLINGELWIRRESLFSSSGSDKDYVVEFLEDERARIKFGDGVLGQIPVGTGTIEYRYGGGAAGNLLQRGRLNQILTTIQDASAVAVDDITVVNTTLPAGGRDRPSLLQQVPALVRSKKELTRTVTIQDFEDNALDIPGVARALALDRSQEAFYELPQTIDRGTVILYVVPEAEGGFTPELVSTIENYFLDPETGKPRMHDKVLSVVEANYLDVTISGTVSVRRGFPTSILISIQNVLEGYFNPLGLDRLRRWSMNWGVKKPLITYSQLHDQVMRFERQGVVGVNFTSPTGDIQVPNLLFPRLVDISNLEIQEVDDLN